MPLIMRKIANIDSVIICFYLINLIHAILVIVWITWMNGFFFIVTSLFLCNQFSPSHHFVHKTYASCTVIIFSVQRNLNHIEKQDIQFQGWIRLWYFEMALKRKQKLNFYFIKDIQVKIIVFRTKKIRRFHILTKIITY